MNPEMSTPSSLSGVSELALKFEERSFDHFFVEFVEVGGDMVYHFWPPKGALEFDPRVLRALDRGFQRTLPSWAQVKGNYTSLEEARVLHAEGVGTLVPQNDSNNEDAQPRATVCVRVVDGMSNPVAAVFLKDRVFRNIEAVLAEGA